MKTHSRPRDFPPKVPDTNYVTGNSISIETNIREESTKKVTDNNFFDVLFQ